MNSVTKTILKKSLNDLQNKKTILCQEILVIKADIDRFKKILANLEEDLKMVNGDTIKVIEDINGE